MKDRVTIFGYDEKDERILVAIKLRVEDKLMDIWSFPIALVNDELNNAIHKTWLEGGEVEFPDGVRHFERSWEEDVFLPDEVKPEHPGIVKRIQNEWSLKLLSNRLYESVLQEVNDLQEHVTKVGIYEQSTWDQSRKIWNKIAEHSKEHNITWKHTSQLRDKLNTLFDTLKGFKEMENNANFAVSKDAYDKFFPNLQKLEKEIDGDGNMAKLFNSLKTAQQEIKKAPLNHKHRRELWNFLDKCFNKVKAGRKSEFKNKLNSRIEGLTKAIERMESSIKRDRDSLDYQKRKLSHPAASQLEFQLRNTKIKVMEDRMASKDEKLQDMVKTLKALTGKNKNKPKEKKEAPKPATADKKVKAETPPKEKSATPKEEPAKKVEKPKAKKEVAKETPKAENQLNQNPD